MNTKELNDELDAFRECVIDTAEGTHSAQMRNHLSDLADKLEAAQDDDVPDEVKATVLSLGKLVVRAALSPDWTIGEFDSKLIGSILQRGTLLQ